MKRVFIFAGAGLGLLLIVLAALPFFIPASVYKAQIETAASNALGRPVSVDGEARISIFPVISASVEDVRVANPDGFEAPNMIEAGALRGSVKLLPLFSRRVEVKEISFEDASVRLTRTAAGEVNWEFERNTAPDDGANPQPSGDPFSASIDRARLRNASLVYEDLQSGIRYDLSDFNAEASLKSADRPMTLRANGVFQNERFEFDLTLTSPEALLSGVQATVDARLGSDLGNVSFDGTITNEDAMNVSGRYSANIPQLSDVTSFLDIALPVDLAPLGGLRASGSIEGALPDLSLNFSDLTVSGDGLNLNYNGMLHIRDTPEFDGQASLDVRDAFALSRELGLPLQPLSAFKQLSINSRLEGPATALNFAGITARSNSPSLSASYSGSISLADDGRVDGDLSAKSDQLRQLLSQLGVELPEGTSLKSASVSGRARGNFQRLGLESGTFALDDTQATGSISADLSAAVPAVKADLKTSRLDLSPFLGSDADQPAASQPSAWSEAPLDLAALNLLDADIALVADEIDIGKIQLKNSDLSVSLKSGRLDANLNRFSAFGGSWNGKAIVDAAGSTPAFDFEMAASSVEAQSLLSSLAGFDKLSGGGQFSIDVAASGASINQIVNAIDGSLSLEIGNGALQGVNLGQLVRSAGSLREALSSGNLTLQSLGEVVSPQAETDFTNFSATLDIQDGLAQIQSLSLVNSVMNVSGAGQIGIGGRTLDVKLTPAIDRAGQGNTATVQLNGIPVPLRVQGSWNAPRFTPDFSGVQSALASNVRDRAASELQDRIGGELGAIASDVIGGRQPGASADKTGSQPQSPADDSQESATSPEADAPNESEGEEGEESESEKAIKGVLGLILGPN